VVSRDAGLQPERTALAWRRTGLAMLVNGALLVRAAAQARSPALVWVSVLVVLASLGLFAVAEYRHRVLLRAGAPPSPHAALAALLLVSVWLACAAAVLSMSRW
jgi:uncharacterized membrane protein YidH (DUF202 family)